MIKELLGIIYSYLDWPSDIYLLGSASIIPEKEYIKHIWRKYTHFEIITEGTIVKRFVNGKLHDDDEPTKVWNLEYGMFLYKEWYRNGKIHRGVGLPAMETGIGDKHWYKNGKRHRSGGFPAIEYADGTKSFYVNGKCFRENNLPVMERSDGRHYWLKDGTITSYLHIKSF